MMHIFFALLKRHAILARLIRVSSLLVLLALLAACASTTPPTTETGRIADAMRKQGVDIVNLRRVAAPASRGKVFRESEGFDIPGIDLRDKPAGTIGIYRDERSAKSDQRVFSLLGKAGPQSQLDYVTIKGTSALILDHRLPQQVADRYISAFSASQ